MQLFVEPYLAVLCETVVVRFSTPCAVAAIHQLAQVFEPAEAMQVRRARVQPLQHVLLTVDLWLVRTYIPYRHKEMDLSMK